MFANRAAERESAEEQRREVSTVGPLRDEHTFISPEPTSPEQRLWLAASSGDLHEAQRLLREEHADPNSSPVRDKPPLMVAVGQRDRSMTELLIGHGARVNIKDDSLGSTPFMIAGVNDDTEMMKLLMRHGAKIDARDDEGDDVREYPPPGAAHEHVSQFMELEEQRRAVLKAAAEVARRRTLSTVGVSTAASDAGGGDGRGYHSANAAATVESAAARSVSDKEAQQVQAFWSTSWVRQLRGGWLRIRRARKASARSVDVTVVSAASSASLG